METTLLALLLSLLILPTASMAPSAQSVPNRQTSLNVAVCAGVSALVLGLGIGIGLGALIFRKDISQHF